MPYTAMQQPNVTLPIDPFGGESSRVSDRKMLGTPAVGSCPFTRTQNLFQLHRYFLVTKYL